MSDWIVTDPEILGGKPCIRGTRISVELLLELLASGASRDDVLKTYPAVTDEGLNAAMAYAASVLKNELVWETRVGG